MRKSHFLSCDWGTSSFRLKLVDRWTGRIVTAVESVQGVKSTYLAWENNGQYNRKYYFEQVLRKHIIDLQEQAKESLQGLPLVLSGMASSSIGMLELPYAEVPTPLTGRKLQAQSLPASKDFPHVIHLISGVRKPDDIMRGEEIQAIGWFQMNDQVPDKALLILPGTHSKHVWIEAEHIVDFQTFMTGELYELLSNHSILRTNISPRGAWNAANRAAFNKGVRKGKCEQFTNKIFAVRALQLGGKMDSLEAGYFLSGLLIGHELSSLANIPITLGGKESLNRLYEQAIKVLGISAPVTTLTPEETNNLVAWGQLSYLSGVEDI